MFKTDLVTKRDMSKDFCWILTEPLMYENDKYRIIVKEGFDFDFASIPWLLRRVLPKNGMKYDRASCLHDALYASQALPKEACDMLFKEAMLTDKVDNAVANSMYLSVDWFGKSAYNDTDVKYKNFVEVLVK